MASDKSEIDEEMPTQTQLGNYYHFGEVAFSSEDQENIQKYLQTKLPKDFITWRVGPGGQKVPYIESWRAIDTANTVFGFNGWSSQVINLTQDYLDQDNQGRVSCGITAVVRVQLKDGTYHEDVGYGFSENQRGKGAALEKAKKEAVSDALKRALRLFGNGLGNSVYDRDWTKKTQSAPAQPQTAAPAPFVPPANPNTSFVVPGNAPPPQSHFTNQQPFVPQGPSAPYPPPANR